MFYTTKTLFPLNYSPWIGGNIEQKITTNIWLEQIWQICQFAGSTLLKQPKGNKWRISSHWVFTFTGGMDDTWLWCCICLLDRIGDRIRSLVMVSKCFGPSTIRGIYMNLLQSWTNMDPPPTVFIIAREPLLQSPQDSTRIQRWVLVGCFPSESQTLKERLAMKIFLVGFKHHKTQS